MKLNLQARIVILVQIMLLLVGALLMYLSGQVYNREFINLYRDEAMDKLHILANSVDADAMVAMVEKGIPYDEVDLIQAQFNSVKEEEWKQRGANIIIYANQLMRAAVPAIQKTAESILQNHRSEECDKDLMPFKEIIRMIPEE